MSFHHIACFCKCSIPQHYRIVFRYIMHTIFTLKFSLNSFNALKFSLPKNILCPLLICSSHFNHVRFSFVPSLLIVMYGISHLSVLCTVQEISTNRNQ
ncbi:hypothetical protein C0J52_02716 [Blattella germanica]|nr:hypothetical protein C0J52_02716 [Blattella germanica]